MERQTAIQSTRLTDPLRFQFEDVLDEIATVLSIASQANTRLLGAFLQDDTTKEGRDIYAAVFLSGLTGYQSNEVERMSASQLIPGELKEPSFIYLANEKYLVFGEWLRQPNDDLVPVTLVTQTIACGSLEFTVFVILSGHEKIKGFDSVEQIDSKTSPTLLHQLKMHVDTIKNQVEDLSTGAFLSEVLDASVGFALGFDSTLDETGWMNELCYYLDRRAELLLKNEGQFVAIENNGIIALKDTFDECNEWAEKEGQAKRQFIAKIRKTEFTLSRQGVRDAK